MLTSFWLIFLNYLTPAYQQTNKYIHLIYLHVYHPTSVISCSDSHKSNICECVFRDVGVTACHVLCLLITYNVNDFNEIFIDLFYIYSKNL